MTTEGQLRVLLASAGFDFEDDAYTNGVWAIVVDWEAGNWCLYHEGEDEPRSEGLLASLPELLKELSDNLLREEWFALNGEDWVLEAGNEDEIILGLNGVPKTFTTKEAALAFQDERKIPARFEAKQVHTLGWRTH